LHLVAIPDAEGLEMVKGSKGLLESSSQLQL